MTKADEKETTRVEAFSDGVFAIAITLLILEVKVPHAGDGTLADGLLKLWPSYIAYALGFTTIGVMWLNHHRLFQLIHHVDDVLMFLNLLLLFLISFTPFPTAVLAEHLGTPGARTAALLYSGVSIIISIAFNLVWWYAASKNGRLLGGGIDLTKVQAITKQYGFGPLFYVIAFAAAWWSANLSVGICMALALFFSLPLAHFARK